MQKNILIQVTVEKEGDEFAWQQHLQSIANTADFETIETLGTYANKPGVLAKLKGMINNPVIKTLAKTLG